MIKCGIKSSNILLRKDTGQAWKLNWSEIFILDFLRLSVDKN